VAHLKAMLACVDRLVDGLGAGTPRKLPRGLPAAAAPGVMIMISSPSPCCVKTCWSSRLERSSEVRSIKFFPSQSDEPTNYYATADHSVILYHWEDQIIHQ
jgi:hypothetical protein